MSDVKAIDASLSKAAQSVSSKPLDVASAQKNAEAIAVQRQQKAPEVAQEEIEVTPDAVQDAVVKLNDYVQSVQRDLQFSLDDSTGQTVVKVLDRTTQEVVRQIPDETALKLAANLHREEPLTLLDTIQA